MHVYIACMFRLTSWNNAKQYCRSRGKKLPSFSIQSDLEAVQYLTRNTILEAGWQAIGQFIYVGHQTEQVIHGLLSSPLCHHIIVLRISQK